jgi:flagellar biosynthetic protein FliQ
MTMGMALQLVREGILETLILAGPILLIAMAVGLIIAILQATTSIQEQTISFVPKIAAILIGMEMEEVLAVMVPELPAVDAAAGDDLRNWQVRIMQDYYRIHREKIRFVRP